MKNIIDIKKIRDRFYVFYDYVVQNQGTNIFFEEMKKSIDTAFNNSNSTYLKKVDKELNVWLIEMFRPHEKEELTRLLKEKLNEDVAHEDLRRIKKINKIVSRGKINTLSEYALLKQRVEEIYADESKSNEVELINNLLAEFYKS